MERAADVDQGVIVNASVTPRLRETRFHGGQHFARFFEEDFEHFAVGGYRRWRGGGRGYRSGGRFCGGGLRHRYFL